MSRTMRFWSTCVLFAVLAAAIACSNPEAEKQKFLDSGNAFSAEGKDNEAILQYRNALRVDQKFGEARWQLARALDRSGNLQAAALEYIRAADVLPERREVQKRAIEMLLVGRRFEDAEARAEAWLKRDPKDVEAMLLRAHAMAGLKQPDEAIKDVEDAIKLNPENDQSYFSLGLIQLASGKAAQAEAALRTAVKLNPQSAIAQVALANYLFATKRPADAEAALKAALAAEPDHALANRLLAALYLMTGRRAEAEAPLKTFAALSSGPGGKLQLADYYIGGQRKAEALAILTPLAANSVDAEIKIAELDYGEGRKDAGHHRLDGVIKRFPNNGHAAAVKARLLLAEDKTNEALTYAQAAVKADANLGLTHFVLALVHERRGSVNDAIAAYSEVLRLNPNAFGAQLALGRLNLMAGDAQTALNYAQQAKTAQPMSVAARVLLARSLLARGDLSSAQTQVTVLQKALPNDATVASLAGTLHRLRGEESAARQSYERALKLSPQQTDALAGLTLLDVRSKQTASAIQRLDKALAAQPRDAEVLTLLADTYRAVPDYAKAEQALKQAIGLAPNYAPAYSMLATIYVAQRRLDEARREFEGILQRNPSSPVGPRTMIGMILQAQNKPDEAKKWYEETVAAHTNAPVAANNLAFMYAESGSNLNVALDLAKAAKQAIPDNPDVDDTLGWVYYKRDLATMAIPPLKESVERNPAKASYRYHLGLAYLKAGEVERGRAELEKALRLQPESRYAEEAKKSLATARDTTR